MFVDTGMLHAGAADSHRAGAHADDGANHLASTSPVAGMFGDFAAAHDFHDAVSAAHAQHTATLRGHATTLNDVGVQAGTAATEFTETEDRNTAAMDAVGCD